MVNDAQMQDKNKREESWYFVRTMCIYSGKICRVSVLLGKEVKTLQGKYKFIFILTIYCKTYPFLTTRKTKQIQKVKLFFTKKKKKM